MREGEIVPYIEQQAERLGIQKLVDACVLGAVHVAQGPVYRQLVIRGTVVCDLEARDNGTWLVNWFGPGLGVGPGILPDVRSAARHIVRCWRAENELDPG